MWNVCRVVSCMSHQCNPLISANVFRPTAKIYKNKLDLKHDKYVVRPCFVTVVNAIATRTGNICVNNTSEYKLCEMCSLNAFSILYIFRFHYTDNSNERNNSNNMIRIQIAQTNRHTLHYMYILPIENL